MQLIENWRTVLSKAWSIRFFVLSAMLEAAQIAIQQRQIASDNPDVQAVLQIAGLGTALAGVIVRLIDQGGLKNDTK